MNKGHKMFSLSLKSYTNQCRILLSIKHKHSYNKVYNFCQRLSILWTSNHRTKCQYTYRIIHPSKSHIQAANILLMKCWFLQKSIFHNFLMFCYKWNSFISEEDIHFRQEWTHVGIIDNLFMTCISNSFVCIIDIVGRSSWNVCWNIKCIHKQSMMHRTKSILYIGLNYFN